MKSYKQLDRSLVPGMNTTDNQRCLNRLKIVAGLAIATPQCSYADGESIAYCVDGQLICQADFNNGFEVTLGGQGLETYGACRHCESSLYTAIRLDNGRLLVTEQAGRGYGDEYGAVVIHRLFGSAVEINNLPDRTHTGA